MIRKSLLVKLNKLDRKGLGKHMFNTFPSHWPSRLEYARKIDDGLRLLEEHNIVYPNLKDNLRDYIDGLLD